MKISPLDIKKKKVIQNIRTLLNDHPDLHPLAHNVLLSATYTVLSRLHKDMLEIDGYGDKYSSEQRVAGYAKAIQTAKQFTSKRSVNLAFDGPAANLGSKHKRDKDRELEETEIKNKESKEREKKRKKDLERQREIDQDIVELMGFDRDII